MINDSIIIYVLQISASSNQFHKYYQYGEFQDCEAYQQDLKNCFLWKTRKSMDAMVLWFLLILCIRTPHSLSLSQWRGEGGGCPRCHFVWRVALSVGAVLWDSNTSWGFEKCCQNAGNAISDTQILNNFGGGGHTPGPPRLTRLTAGTYTRLGEGGILRTPPKWNFC